MKTNLNSADKESRIFFFMIFFSNKFNLIFHLAVRRILDTDYDTKVWTQLKLGD